MQRVFYIFMYELLDVVSILFNATRRGEFVKKEKSFQSFLRRNSPVLLIENEFDSKEIGSMKGNELLETLPFSFPLDSKLVRSIREISQ